MKKFGITKFAFILFCMLAVPLSSSGQDTDPCRAKPDFDRWLNCRVDHITAAHINQSEPSKQVETPSIGENTTSLVDQSQAPDLFGFAMNLAGLNSKSSETESTSGTITSSAYAFYALASKRDPLDPAFYSKHSGLRRFSFTLGRELPDDKNPSGNNRATILGVKVLFINKRDASHPNNRTKLEQVARSLEGQAVAFANIATEVQDFLYAELAPTLLLPAPAMRTPADFDTFINVNLGTNFTATIGQLTQEQLKEVDSIITRRISSQVSLTQAVRQTVEEIRRAPQLSLTVQSKLRDEDGADIYRGGVIFDYGLYRRVNLAVNATFDYEDNKIIGGDKRGGRLAAETHFHLTPQKNIFEGKDPLVFSVAGESKWMTEAKPSYTGQLKIVVPIFDGLNVPLSVSFANRSDLINEKSVKGRFGFTFDYAKLLKGLR